METSGLEKIKEYDRFILFRHKKTGIRECIMKIDLIPPEVLKVDRKTKWEVPEHFDY